MRNVKPKQVGPTARPEASIPKRTFEPRPCGALDYEALAAEVMRKYPKVLARLGE